MNNIILMGLKNCGKTTASRIISRSLSIPALDTDEIIFELYKKSPRELYSEKGEAGFLEAEAKACEVLCEKLSSGAVEKAVIATGGGICTNHRALSALRGEGVFVFLSARESLIQKRVFAKAVTQKDGSFTNIPAYIKKKNPASLEDAKRLFHEFFTERNRLYEKIADVTVDVSRGTREEIAQNIIQKTGEYFARRGAAV